MMSQVRQGRLILGWGFQGVFFAVALHISEDFCIILMWFLSYLTLLQVLWDLIIYITRLQKRWPGTSPSIGIWLHRFTWSLWSPWQLREPPHNPVRMGQSRQPEKISRLRVVFLYGLSQPALCLHVWWFLSHSKYREHAHSSMMDTALGNVWWHRRFLKI